MPTIGEYERGVGAGENDETCSSMRKSWVALVNITMPRRKSAGRGRDWPYALIAFKRYITICRMKTLEFHLTRQRADAYAGEDVRVLTDRSPIHRQITSSQERYVLA